MSDHSGSEVIRIGQSHPALGPWKLESNRVGPIGLRNPLWFELCSGSTG